MRRPLQYGASTAGENRFIAAPQTPLGAYEYIEHLFPSSEKKPFRLWIQVSENDNGSKTPSEGRRVSPSTRPGVRRRQPLIRSQYFSSSRYDKIRLVCKDLVESRV